ncbi:MAG TPA: hypothetical protein PLA50_10535 [Bacteroidia bacterium]|nr:hypothetical protein [Bacteroidia bacterium]
MFAKRQTLCALAIVLISGTFVACRTMPGKKADRQLAEESAEAPPPSPPSSSVYALPVGVVEMVEGEAGFILVRSSRGLQIEPGTVLTIHGNSGQPAASAVVSPARKGAFITADISSGTPVKGQQVTMAYDPSARTTAPPLDQGSNAIQVLE